MNRLLLMALLIAFPLVSFAQPEVTDSMNTEHFWQTIVFEDHLADSHELMLPADAQHRMVVASNRTFDKDRTRFIGEDRGNGALSYYIVFIKDDHWQVWRTTLEAAIGGVSDRNADWVVYTEGYGKIFTTGLYRGLSMAMQHQLNVIYLDYPSYSTAKGMLANYKFALNNAKQAGYDFAPLLQTIKDFREQGKMGSGRMTLFFHSMGNNAIRELATHDLLNAFNDRVWVDNLVLNSACVPQKNHAVWIDKIHFARRIYINYNPKDYTLAGAKLVSLTRQLGEGVRGERSKQAIYINFNELCGRNHSNFVRLLSHYRAPPMSLAFYRAVLHGKRVNINDQASFTTSRYRHLGYSIIPQKAMLKQSEKTDPSTRGTQ